MANNKPVHEVRLGVVKAAVWANDTKVGVRYGVTFQRLYKDGDEWKVTNSFGRDDLPLVAKTADMAHTWIYQEGRNGNGGATSDSGNAAAES